MSLCYRNIVHRGVMSCCKEMSLNYASFIDNVLLKCLRRLRESGFLEGFSTGRESCSRMSKFSLFIRPSVRG